jgi:monoamine oxidase
MAKTVPLDAPYNAPSALEWDSKTVDTWMRENLPSPKARDVFSLAVEAVLSVEPRDVSLLYFLFYVHSAGSVTALVANAGDGGGQDFRVSGGTQRIAEAMARQLGRRVALGAPVRSITQANQRVEVHADGLRVFCDRVIVAIPPHLAGRIVYSPALPPLRDQLTQRYPIGSLIKTIAVYDRPFWRDDGLNGQVTSDQGPVKAMFDTSPKSGSPGVLMGFIDGDDARVLAGASARKRRARALESYVRYFGEAAGNPRRYLDQPWEREVYTRGCPVGIAPPGVVTSFGRALRAPVGRIHWAGAETATVWSGYMDGAIRSGERAAKEVLS